MRAANVCLGNDSLFPNRGCVVLWQKTKLEKREGTQDQVMILMF